MACGGGNQPDTELSSFFPLSNHPLVRTCYIGHTETVIRNQHISYLVYRNRAAKMSKVRSATESIIRAEELELLEDEMIIEDDAQKPNFPAISALDAMVSRTIISHI